MPAAVWSTTLVPGCVVTVGPAMIGSPGPWRPEPFTESVPRVEVPNALLRPSRIERAARCCDEMESGSSGSNEPEDAVALARLLCTNCRFRMSCELAPSPKNYSA
jgi:hypothetical protein